MAKGIPTKMGRRGRGATERRELAPALYKAVVLVLGDGSRVVVSTGHATMLDVTAQLEQLNQALHRVEPTARTVSFAGVCRVTPYKIGESWNPET